jgi:VWFA-related protein
MNSRAMVLAVSTAVLCTASTRATAQEIDTTKAIPIIKVGLDLVQIDAVITDERGRPVTDLKPGDFKLTVDGKPVAITNSAFFAATSKVGTEPDGAGVESDPSRGGPRSMIFLVDDLNMSFRSAYLAKRALTAFAKDWDTKEALLAIRSVSDESPDVRLSRKPERIDESIRKVRYNIRSNKGASSAPSFAIAASRASAADMAFGLVRPADGGAADFSNPALVRANFEQRVYSLLSTVNALRSVPGRKAVVFISEGFDLQNNDHRLGMLGVDSPFDSLFGDDSVGNALRSIVEVANRASVVVYTLDPSGLLAEGPGADIASMPSDAARSSAALARFSAQGTLRELADGTGGLSVYNRNDLKGGLTDVVADQRAYYLIGFEPPAEAFDRKKSKAQFHKIRLKVERPGLRVRTREGFYGVTDQELLERAPLVATK